MIDLDELKEQQNATDYLAKCLSSGTLVLFLGAGASKGFGLPDWLTLVNKLREKVGLDILKGGKKVSADTLQHGASEVVDKMKRPQDLVKAIEEILYKDFQKLSVLKAFENKLLVSISALLMGSKRGHITRVVTLNYDSMLEWFLSIYGFVVKTVYKLPELEGTEDVRIYHPHGFVPLPVLGIQSSDFVILDMHSANQRLGNPHDPWFEMTRHILDTGVCLFVGMSANTLSDRILAPLLSTSGPKCGETRPLGIWLLKDALTRAKEQEFGRNNIVPLSITSEDGISEFILDICQKASRKLLVS